MRALLVCSLLCLPLHAANKTDADDALPKLIWHTPPNWTEQDWVCGPGGCDLTPAPPFRFVREEMSGTNPKISVKDSRNRSWSIKFGAEALPECFASRFVTALGYFGEITYFVPTGKVDGVQKLGRASRFIKPDGSFNKGRFELRGQPGPAFLEGRAWGWDDNPFRGTHELAGLKIVMMLLSNWDAKDARDDGDSNNGVFRTTLDGKPELFFAVFDWGASLGQWGGQLRRDKCDCSAFSRDTPHFVQGVHGDHVAWGFVGKHRDSVEGGITLEDVRWLLPYLQRITSQDLQAGLKACGATERQTACWRWAIQDRVRQMAAVAGSTSVTPGR